MQVQSLKPTSWLAERLGLSVSTVERLRAQGSPDLPAHVMVGNSVRYDEQFTEAWIQARLNAAAAKQQGENHGPSQ
jgi:predicted DNA-binding transcriptional regulator AlpA